MGQDLRQCHPCGAGVPIRVPGHEFTLARLPLLYPCPRVSLLANEQPRFLRWFSLRPCHGIFESSAGRVEILSAQELDPHRSSPSPPRCSRVAADSRKLNVPRHPHPRSLPWPRVLAQQLGGLARTIAVRPGSLGSTFYRDESFERVGQPAWWRPLTTGLRSKGP